MPSKIARPCSYPSCPSLALSGKSRCAIHALKERQANDQIRGNSVSRGYDAAWNKVRNMKANRNPLCEMCLLKNIEKPLDVVHHIKDIEHYPELRLVMENLLSLCTEHHEGIHGPSRYKPRVGVTT